MSRVEVTAAPPGIVTAVGPLAGGAIAAIVQQAADKRKQPPSLNKTTTAHNSGCVPWAYSFAPSLGAFLIVVCSLVPSRRSHAV